MSPPTPAPAKTGLDKPLALTIATFDHFTYDLKIGGKTPGERLQPESGRRGRLPDRADAGQDEKPEDKKKLDKEFQDKTKALQDKLSRKSRSITGLIWSTTG